jgi:hypothetical protein
MNKLRNILRPAEETDNWSKYYISKLRDFFGFPKEVYEWDVQDIKISFFSILLFLVMAASPFISKSNVANSDNIKGHKMAAIILGLLALFSFIWLIVLASRNKRNPS